MTRSMYILVCGILFISCSKNGEVPGNGQNPTTPSAEDGLRMPYTKGSYWKYIRYDTTKVILRTTGRQTAYRVDSSEELITLTGDTLIPSIDATSRLFVLQISNLTRNKLDTNFMLYTNTKFALYGHMPSQAGGVFFVVGTTDTLNLIPAMYISNEWRKFVKFSLPVTNSPNNIDSIHMIPQFNLGYDTSVTRKDTSLLIAGNMYTGCVYVNAGMLSQSLAPSGVLGVSYAYTAFIKPAIGFVYVKQTPLMGQRSVYSDVDILTWFTRKLVSYKVL